MPQESKTFSFVDNGVTINGSYHLRELTSAGHKLGGGIDTPTLCGINNSCYFDVTVPITATTLKAACKTCSTFYYAEPVF